jgi:DNA helicase II / ATP-dependent DNA helicase PcrA
MPNSILAGLNPEQLKAVTLPHQSALILAGAGSGKTRVLTSRIAHLLQGGAASPANILAVTFTNKAAREMQLRISTMLPINIRSMWIGTFHGLCNRMLRLHHAAAGLPQTFQILDMADQLAAVKRVLKAANINEEKFPPRKVQQFINSYKEQGLRAHQAPAHDPHSRTYQQLYELYDAQCNREGAVDFAELLLRCFELLVRDEALRTHYQERFRYILVDEFQDTNVLQYQWLKLLAGPETAVFAVGDDDQSIYAFRGANTGNMREFERDFCKDNVIRLEQNYRSFGNILDCANALIAHNNNRLGKNLWTDAGKGEPVRIFRAESDFEEAQFIVDEVRALHRAGLDLSNMALLYRSNAQSRVLEHALFNAGLPYRVYGGLRFFERQEVKHALAYLRLVANLEDDIAALRVLNFPARGIGARTIENLQDGANALQVPLLRAAHLLSGRSGTGVKTFIQMIESLRAQCQGRPLPEQLQVVIDGSGLTEHYRNEKDGAERLENLSELVNAATVFLQENITPEGEPLAEFLTHAALEAGEHGAEAGEDALQMMTVHAAKGLEFDAVFVSGLEEGLFPHENSFDEADGLEEERRLMYVAITRARQRLYLSYAGARMLHNQRRYGIESRFLQELPAPLLKHMNSAPPSRSFASASSYGTSSGYGTPASARPVAAAPEPAFRQSPESQAAATGGFYVGQNVRHAFFGDGTIVAVQGSGDQARVQVKFSARRETKWLAVAVAKLLPV